MTTKVYAYGCKPIKDTASVALIDAQVSAAFAYYNKLIDLHNEYRTRRDEAIRSVCPDYEAAHAAVDAADAEAERVREVIRLANAVARRKRATPEEGQTLRDAWAVLKVAREARRAVRATCMGNADLQIRLAALDCEYNGVPIPDSPRRKGGHFKEARAACGVYWGSYLACERAVEQAIEKTMIPPIRRRRWTGDGLVAVQVQGGATWQEIVVGTGRVGNLIRFDGLTARGKHKAPVASFRLCVNTDEHRRPLWVPISAYFHRPLPSDAKVMGVALVRTALPPHRTKGGWKAQYSWELQFTVRTCEEKTHASAGDCGIDLGWRVRPDGSIRVAYLADDAGHHAEFCLPASLLGRYAKSDELQALRDDNFNGIVAMLREWVAEHESTPDWLKAELVGAHLWKRKARLINVLNLWKDRVFPGDEEIYQAVLAWRAQDTHLWQWEFCNRRKAERIRKALYRQFAARLRQRYATIVVEDCDWRQLARKADADSNEQDRSRKYMRIASIGMLRQLLVADGAIPSDAKDTTRTCNVCGVVEDWDQAAELEHTCANGHTWDQDHNAALNLLARAKVLKTAAGQGVAQVAAGHGEADGLGAGASRGAEGQNGTAHAANGNGHSNRWKRRKEDRSRRLAEMQQNAGGER